MSQKNDIQKVKINSVTVLLAAAGSGTRMGGVYKPLEMLCNKPVISYSLQLFQDCPMVKKVVIAAREDKINDLRVLCDKSNFSKVTSIIPGGKDRQNSVEKSFNEAFKTPSDVTKLVAIHDAARPLLTQKALVDVFDTAFAFGASACAARVRDTVNRTNPSAVITEQVERNDLWLMQTPQVFDTDIYHTAIGASKKSGIKVTDDCGLVTSLGFKVVLCPTDSSNIKLTYPEDMFLAEAIIEKRMREDKCE